MKKFETRSNQPELLDQEYIPEQDLIRNLQELKIINQFLGGHKVVIDGLKIFSKSRPKMFVVEMGSGGGDNLWALSKQWPEYQYEGVDLKETCTRFAQKQYPGIRFQTADYAQAGFAQKPDVLFNSLFCHHFTDAQLVDMLRFMKQNSQLGFFIGDLHRHGLAYYAIQWLTLFFSKSYLVKNDAPLSVLRGFKRAELEYLLAKAGIQKYKIYWKWAFRFLIVVEHEKP